AAAAAYYLNVLKADPKNPDLLGRAFLSVLTGGDIDQAGKLADRLLQVDRTDRIARLVVGVRALKQKDYYAARQNFGQSVRGPAADLTATLSGARRQQGRCAQGLWRLQQSAAGPSADRPGNEGDQRRRQDTAPGRFS